MRYLLLIVMLTSFGCAIVPKETRQCLKAQERVLKKCGTSFDSLVIPYSAVVEIKGGRTALSIDTAAIGAHADTVWQDSIRVIYKWRTPARDTIEVDVLCPDKTVTVTGTVNCPPVVQINAWGVIGWQVWGWIKRLWWLLLVIAASTWLVYKAYRIYFPRTG